MRVLPALLLLGSLMAGCSSSGVGSQPDRPADPCALTAFDPEGIQLLNTTDDPIEDDRDLAYEFSTTNKRTCSLPAIGHAVLGADGPHKYIGEMDLRGDLDLGAVAVLGNGEDPVVYLLDITDRARPTVLSSIAQAGTYIVDVKLSDDGKALYTASQAVGPEGIASLAAGTAPVGFSVYSLADPLHPTLMGTVADPGLGCHMLDPVQVSEDEDAVFCISNHLRSYLVNRAGPVLVNQGFVDYVPTRGGIPAPGEVPAVGDPTCALPAGCQLAETPHDVTVWHSEGSFGKGSSYAVVSHWGEGVKVLDITDAPVVTEAGSWDGEGATHYAGNVHTAMVVETAEHRYVIASPEYTGGGTVPSIWVLEADDFGAMKLVGEWFHPGAHDSQGLYLTTHQWQAAPRGPVVNASDVRIYLTYNHAGVWVLDLGAILAGDNQAAILGYNLARAPLDKEASVPNAVLSTWDVNVVDGHIYGTDRATGLWVFHYAGDTLGDPRLNGYA